MATRTAHHARSALTERSHTDTLGGIFARQVGPMGAALVAGTVDASDVGKRFEAFTGGWVDLSTAYTILGGIARGLRFDQKYLGRYVARANTHNLNAMLPVIAYGMGNRIPGAIKSRVGGSPSGVSGVEGAPAQKAAPPPTDGVPGEATIS